MALGNEVYGEAVDMTLSSPSSSTPLWLLCKSVVEEDTLSLVFLDIESTLPGGDVLNSRASIIADANVTDFQLINSIPGASVYPCTLLALFSAGSGVAYIVEGEFWWRRMFVIPDFWFKLVVLFLLSADRSLHLSSCVRTALTAIRLSLNA